MGAITESGGFKGAETRVLVDSMVGFEALIGTGHVSLLKVSFGSVAKPPMRSQSTRSLLYPEDQVRELLSLFYPCSNVFVFVPRKLG